MAMNSLRSTNPRMAASNCSALLLLPLLPADAKIAWDGNNRWISFVEYRNDELITRLTSKPDVRRRSASECRGSRTRAVPALQRVEGWSHHQIGQAARLSCGAWRQTAETSQDRCRSVRICSGGGDNRCRHWWLCGRSREIM